MFLLNYNKSGYLFFVFLIMTLSLYTKLIQYMQYFSHNPLEIG